MSEFDRLAPTIKMEPSLKKGMRRLALAGGFAIISGAYITPVSAISTSPESQNIVYQRPTSTLVPAARSLDNLTRTPTPDAIATQIHEMVVTQSALTSRSSQLESAATHQAAAIQTMTEGNREVRSLMKEKDIEIKTLQYGLALTAIIAAGFLIRRSYKKSSHGGGHH